MLNNAAFLNLWAHILTSSLIPDKKYFLVLHFRGKKLVFIDSNNFGAEWNWPDISLRQKQPKLAISFLSKLKLVQDFIATLFDAIEGGSFFSIANNAVWTVPNWLQFRLQIPLLDALWSKNKTRVLLYALGLIPEKLV